MIKAFEVAVSDVSDFVVAEDEIPQQSHACQRPVTELGNMVITHVPGKSQEYGQIVDRRSETK